MHITIAGDLAHPRPESDSTHIYTVTLSDPPTMTPERFERYILDIVKAASGAGEWIIEKHRVPRESSWQPYVSEVTQVNPLLWKVTIVYPFTD